MDYEFESITPWNGEHDTGRDARLKLDRNFAKIKSNFEELAGSRYVTTDFFARLFAPEGEDGAEVDVNDMEAVINAVRVKFGLHTDSYISAKGKNPDAGGAVSGLTELSKLTDVALTEQQDGQVLAWDAAKQKWVNKTQQAGLDETALAQYLVNNNYVTQSWLEEQKYATQQWVTKTLEQYVTAEDIEKAVAEAVSAALAGKVDTTFFARLLAAIAGDGTEISVNDMETAIASIKVKFGLWGNSWISAKGQNPDAGGSVSGATDLDGLTDVTLTSPQNGQVLAYDGSQWVNKTLEAGLDETALAQYLVNNNYVTQTWVNSQNYATVADLDARIDALVNGAPAAFDTLKEIADVLQGNVDSIGDILTALGNKADKTITITAGAGLTGGGDLSANRTMALATVGTAGTYTKVTVDAYGRVTGHSSLAAGDIPTLSISKITGLQSALDAKLDAATFNDLFEKVEISTGVYAIRAKYGLYSNDWISAKGANPDAGGSVSGASSLEELSDVALSNIQDGQVLAYDTATQKWVNKTQQAGLDETALAKYLTTNQYAKKSDIPSLAGYATQAWVNTQLGSYATTSAMNSALGNKADKTITITAGTGLTGGGNLSANRTLSLATVGTAGTYTKVTVDAYGRVTGHASLAAGDIPNLPWSKITSGKPTTLAGYGITDAYTKTESEGRYVKKSGDTMTGSLTVNTGTGTRIVLGSGIQLWANAAGGWARSFAVYNSSGESTLENGSICGAYGTANTLNYMYYGGTYNSPAMVILPSNKYVGIGTTSPSYKLHVVGGIYSSEYIQIGSGRIKWDSSNNALYVEKSDGTAIGFYSKGFISAKGANDDAGGSASGVTELGQLSDVSLGTLANGQALVWNGSQWVNKTIEGGLDETALAEYLTGNGYATQTWATSQFANKTGTNASGTWPISINGNASTASKWATARKLTLTGDVTGSVSMDGSANVSLATEVSDYVFTFRGDVTTATSIPTASELADATLQGTYRVRFPGAMGELINFFTPNGSAAYTQLYHTYNGNMMWRSSTDSTLSGKAWRTLLDTNNYTSYLDSRYLLKSSYTAADVLAKLKTVDGSGSGLDADTLDGRHETSFMRYAGGSSGDVDAGSVSLFRHTGYGYSVDGWKGNGGYLSFGTTNYVFQIQGVISGDDVFYRRCNNGTWRGWKQFAFTDSNVYSATKLQTARKIWGQSFNGEADVSGALSNATTITASGLISTTGASYTGANNYGVSFRAYSSSHTSIEICGGGYVMGLGCNSSGSWHWWRGTSGYASSAGKSYVMQYNGSTWAFTGSISASSTITASGQIQGGSFKLGSGTITWDSTNNCFHFSHGLYSDSFVSAKGANSGSGGTVSGVTKLSDLSDVQIGTLATNQVLSWNGSKWVNKAISTGLDETALAQYLTNNQYLTMPTGDGRYVTINTDQTITGEKTFANSFSFKYDVDTSRVYTINFNDTSNETMGSIGYLNVSKFFYINPIGSSNPWQDSVGKYSLIIGNNKLTYNTYPILTSNNYASTLDSRYLRTVSLATISDLHASWDALLKAAPSVYVTRWPTASEVGALTQTTADGRYVRDNNASGTTDTNSALSNAVTHNYRWSNAPYNDISSLFDFTYSEDWRTQLFVKHQASTDIRVRSRYSGTTWGSWRTIAFTDSNVESATRLQTARTINGTSFNGTANITTSKWGTARSIYIRDASQAHTGSAVSVDGSANEYLLLPSTITATLSGNASTSSKWATARKLTLTGDVTGSVSMDGSANVSLATEVSDYVFTFRGDVTTATSIPTASELADATLQGTYRVRFPGAMGKLINFFTPNGSAAYTQLYHTYNGNMMWRSSTDSTLSGKAWRTLLDTNNYTSYLDSRYVNTSGDTMTGELTVNTGTGTRIVLGSGIQLWANAAGGWARGLAAYNSSGSATLENGSLCGAYGSGNTLHYTYYGGTYNSPAMVILPSNKYVGIGTTSPSYKLHVAGVAYASTGIFSDGYVSAKGQNTSSDLRLKTILSPVYPSLEAFAKAPLFRFAWKSNPDMVEIGSSAQYWRNVLPDTVKERDGWLEMGYGNIALAGVITIARDFETLEQRVDRLEKENGKLKKRIKELERRAA